jgi:hypothetical protein
LSRIRGISSSSPTPRGCKHSSGYARTDIYAQNS